MIELKDKEVNKIIKQLGDKIYYLILNTLSSEEIGPYEKANIGLSAISLASGLMACIISSNYINISENQEKELFNDIENMLINNHRSSIKYNKEKISEARDFLIKKHSGIN